MNKARCILLSVLVCAALPLGSGPARAQASLDAVLRPLLAAYGLPALAAAVAKKGEIVAAGAVGTRQAGADIPVTVNDRFHIGSDTKAMTALLAAMLVEQGKLRWKSTTAEVFPEFVAGMDPGFATVTLEQLLSHSGGGGRRTTKPSAKSGKRGAVSRRESRRHAPFRGRGMEQETARLLSGDAF